MAAASQKRRKTAAVHSTKALNVRQYTAFLAIVFPAADNVSDFEILIVMFASLHAVPNCVLTKELLTDGLKVLISKEDELLYAARIHTLELPDMYAHEQWFNKMVFTCSCR